MPLHQLILRFKIKFHLVPLLAFLFLGINKLKATDVVVEDNSLQLGPLTRLVAMTPHVPTGTGTKYLHGVPPEEQKKLAVIYQSAPLPPLRSAPIYDQLAPKPLPPIYLGPPATIVTRPQAQYLMPSRSKSNLSPLSSQRFPNALSLPLSKPDPSKVRRLPNS